VDVARNDRLLPLDLMSRGSGPSGHPPNG
jgi:hypothetical protein